MDQTQPPDKTALIETLRSNCEEVVSGVSALGSAKLEQGRYEDGWNGRQILAHITSIE